MSCPNKPIIRKVLSDRERTRYHELIAAPMDYIENEAEIALLKEKARRETTWWVVALWPPLLSPFIATVPYLVHPVLGALVFGASLAFWATGIYWNARLRAAGLDDDDDG